MIHNRLWIEFLKLDQVEIQTFEPFQPKKIELPFLPIIYPNNAEDQLKTESREWS